ncbi:MAG TPA: phosphoribosylaminoimidazolesuccinocarboxamide synthase [Gammaproteobacteria bacterium]|nr:phosphoribosylaminoimidazolesuccinocarboxamide synthase [Gammaproteobacteria bacterium]
MFNKSGLTATCLTAALLVTTSASAHVEKLRVSKNYVQERDAKTNEYVPQIKLALPKTLGTSSLQLEAYNGGNTVKPYVGKVRDRYQVADNIVLVTTDRLTAFDVPIAQIPFKGAVLNLISEYWFKETAKIMPNHLISVPHPNVTIAKSVTPYKVEFVVREYLTGSSGTSIWTLYKKGQRDFGGITLPDGMQQHQKLPHPIITPTTKSDEHDEPLTPAEIVSQGLMTQQQWNECSAKAIELFKHARDLAAKRGLILVDTKMEMGIDANGNNILIDELFTPDSSRYWIASSYDPKAVDKGEAKPKNIDKEFIRVWITSQCDPYKDPIPQVPADQIVELSRRYVLLYEVITGQKFPFDAVIKAGNMNEAVYKELALLAKN